MDRIRDKIKEIEKYLQELSEITPDSLEEYKQSFKTKAACERYSEKIICAIIDLAFLVIKEKNLKIPEEDKEAFDILYEKKIISEALAERLKDAKGMRNILSHQYGKVDDEIVFESITQQLPEDALEFVKYMSKLINLIRFIC